MHGDGCACIILVDVKGRVQAKGDFVPFLGAKLFCDLQNRGNQISSQKGMVCAV